MRWAGAALVVVAAAVGPTMLPPGWIRSGWIPDLAALACVHVAFRGTPDRAGLLGVVLGLAAAPWRPEPAPWLAFVLGTMGYVAGHLAAGVVRDRAGVRAAACALAVLVVRSGTLFAAALSDTEPMGASGAFDGALAMTVAALVGAASSVPFAALVRRYRLLAPLERSFRDV